MRVGCHRRCHGRRSLSLQEALGMLVLEEPGQVGVGPQRQVRVRPQRHRFPALLLLLLLGGQLSPRVPGEAVGVLGRPLGVTVREPVPRRAHHNPSRPGRTPQVSLDGRLGPGSL